MIGQNLICAIMGESLRITGGEGLPALGGFHLPSSAPIPVLRPSGYSLAAVHHAGLTFNRSVIGCCDLEPKPLTHCNHLFCDISTEVRQQTH